MNAQEAFAAYESVRHRLPAVSRAGGGVYAENLDAIADSFDVFLLDAFGVLNIGETAIGGVPERVAGLQKSGKRVLVVSNAASHAHVDLMTKYRRLGYDFDPEDVITSRKTILHALQSLDACKWGLMADPALGGGDLDALDVSYLADDAQSYDAAEAFLLLGSGAWNDARQSLLEASLMRAPRPVYVGNPDIVAPRETHFSTEPGHFAHRLADATGVAPVFFGKPFGNIFDMALSNFPKVARDRILMVGDSLHTDILGGQAAGVQSALIAGYGFFSGEDVVEPIAVSGIEPDYILARP